MVTLFCAIVGVHGNPFSIDIDASKPVDQLKKEIAKEKPQTITREPDKLELFLAKKDNLWLNKEGMKAVALNDEGYPVGFEHMNEMSWLKNPKNFGNNFEPNEEEIHVLVVVPSDEAVIPPLLPTTLHRDPERLKRWSAINAMIRQKNQDAKQKLTTGDAKNSNKKRENDDIDKSVGYSSLRWEDIKPIYNFEDSYVLKPSDIPDAVIARLLSRIVDLRTLYGQITDGNETKRLFFIAPILETVSRLFGDVRILVEEDVVGKNVHLQGRFEFVLQRGTKRISIVQAKREDFLQGVVQNLTGLEALADVEDLTVAYGIVTNFLEWRFLISGDWKVRMHQCSLPVDDTIPSFEGLKVMIGKIYGMLSNAQ